MLHNTGTIGLFKDDTVYCIDCMFKNHSHKVWEFWSLDAEAIAEEGKIYICDDCGIKIE